MIERKSHITLKYKEIDNEKKSAYLDYYKDGKRIREALHLYLLPETSKRNIAANKRTMKEAEAARAAKENELLAVRFGIETKEPSAMRIGEAILNIDKKNTYSIFWAGENYNEFKKNNSKIIFTSKRHGGFYENYYYPSFIKNNNIDLHHVPQNGIGLNSLYTSPVVVTIHDLIPYILPQTVGRGYLERFLKDMPFIINNSKAILTVSEYSKKDILRFFPSIKEEKIFVTPLAANLNYKPLNKTSCKDYIKNKYNIYSPFLLYIGGFKIGRASCRERV